MGMSQPFCKKKFCFCPCNKSFSRPSLFDKDDWICQPPHWPPAWWIKHKCWRLFRVKQSHLTQLFKIKFNKNNHYLENYAFSQTASGFLKAFSREWHFTLFLAIEGKTVSGEEGMEKGGQKSPPPTPHPGPSLKKCGAVPYIWRTKEKLRKWRI